MEGVAAQQLIVFTLGISSHRDDIDIVCMCPDFIERGNFYGAWAVRLAASRGWSTTQ